MMDKIDITQIKKLIQEAKDSVSVVKDPQLRQIAFGRILDFFLSSDYVLEGQRNDKKGGRKILKKIPSKEHKKRKGPKVWMEELIEQDFFKKPKSLKEIIGQLETLGHHLRSSDVQPYLQIFMDNKKLRRKKQAPGGGGKKCWHYVNW